MLAVNFEGKKKSSALSHQSQRDIHNTSAHSSLPVELTEYLKRSRQ